MSAAVVDKIRMHDEVVIRFLWGAVFLASDEASFITGEVLTADGGWSAYGYV